jgi:ABC-type Fe3+-hydroxamate transport system substrate-binding protein
MMKRLFTLALIMFLSACTTTVQEPVNTASTAPETTTTTTTTNTVADTTITVITTVTTTTEETTTTKQEPAICGSYRSVLPAYPEGIEVYDYDYINIDQFDDGHFQVEFRLAIGGSGNDFAVFDTESLGTANWYSYYFDGDMGVPYNNGSVTITSDGTTAWVTYEDGEPQEFKKTE